MDTIKSNSSNRKNRYINTDESVFQILTASTLKVYLALRFEVDFKKEISSIKKTAKEIALQAGLGRTRTFKAFNELEDAGLLKRQETADRRTTYVVAKTPGQLHKETQEKNSTVHDVNSTVHDVNTYQYYNSEYINSLDIDSENQFDFCFETTNPKELNHNINNDYAEYLNLFCQTKPKPTKSDYQNKQVANKQTKHKDAIDKQKEFVIKAKQLKEVCLKDSKCREVFDDKFHQYEIEFEAIVHECYEYYFYEKERVIYPSLVLAWIYNQCPIKKKYKKRRSKEQPLGLGITQDEHELIAGLRQESRVPGLQCIKDSQRQYAMSIVNKYIDQGLLNPKDFKFMNQTL